MLHLSFSPLAYAVPLVPTGDSFLGFTSSAHNAGGSASNFNTVVFGVVGSDSLLIQPPSPFPPGGGIATTRARSLLATNSSSQRFTDPDGNTFNAGVGEADVQGAGFGQRRWMASIPSRTSSPSFSDALAMLLRS